MYRGYRAPIFILSLYQMILRVHRNFEQGRNAVWDVCILTVENDWGFFQDLLQRHNTYIHFARSRGHIDEIF